MPSTPLKNVVCADYRTLNALPATALIAWTDAFAVFNGTFQQLQQITAGAPLESRRLSADVASASLFLAGVREADERARLHTFVNEAR
jgi:hypothetical protein